MLGSAAVLLPIQMHVAPAVTVPIMLYENSV